VAGRQLALITSTQLGASGISKDMIITRRRRGALHRVHRDVYLFGTEMMLPGAIELAAVLACGTRTVVSHRSAVALWRLAAPVSDEAEVTVIGRRCRSRPGVRVHRVGALDARDQRLHRGIPVASPARALLDYAAEAGADEFERALAQARVRNLVTDRELRAAIDRAPYRPGVATVRSVLDLEGGPQWTESEGERRMLRLIREAKLPAPRTQVRIGGWPADFVWPQQRLIVEVDGYPFHSHRRAFERDRRRDAVHIAAGYVVLRFTWRQLTEEPLVVVATIARALDPLTGSSRVAH
jgi:very-short-patch-repair endonuclease